MSVPAERPQDPDWVCWATHASTPIRAIATRQMNWASDSIREPIAMRVPKAARRAAK